jgi:threonylcarbamoyladenosine tRNA methylthiotransferase MtaB
VTQQYILKTLGCKANLYDSQLIEQELQSKGWSPESTPASEGGAAPDPEVKLCIVNSCTVTNEADKQSRKMAAKLARDYPGATVVMTGCGAEVDPEAYLKSKGVDLVIGNQNKNRFVDLLLEQKSEFKANPPSSITTHILKPEIPQLLGTVENYTQIISRHPMDRDWPSALDSFATPPTQLKGSADKTRSFLKIQEGCNSFCTYCIIPYGRGPSRSLRPREILKQVQELVSQGIREVIITGTNIGDYGIEWKEAGTADKSKNLTDLLEMILDQTQLERLRISSLDPSEITPSIIALMESNPRLCPHFHVSLQSPHSRILRLMKRNYTANDVKECLERIAQMPAPLGGVFVGMDIITGFPGETEEEFEWGYNALKQLPWSRLHVFPFSERTGTPATRLPNAVPQHLRVLRARRLTQLSMERLKQNYTQVLERCRSEGLTLGSILTEKQGPGNWISGYTPNYLRVMIPANVSIHRNQLVQAEPMDLMIDSKASDLAFVASMNSSLHHTA